MKKLEIIIRPERLDDLKTILNSNGAHGLMISNIMGYGSQRGHKQVYNGVDFGGNLLPKVKVESIVSDETYEIQINVHRFDTFGELFLIHIQLLNFRT